MKAEDLIGTWSLRSVEEHRQRRLVRRPLAARRSTHAANVAIGRPSRALPRRRRVRRHPEERSEAISTYLSYSGPFEVLADQDTVIHHIQICSFPNWIGNAQVRFANLDGNLLTLSTKPMTFQGVERSAHLVWERVGRD